MLTWFCETALSTVERTGQGKKKWHHKTTLRGNFPSWWEASRNSNWAVKNCNDLHFLKIRNIHNLSETFALPFPRIPFMFLLNAIPPVGSVKYLALKLKRLTLFSDRCCLDYNFTCRVSQGTIVTVLGEDTVETIPELHR